MLEILIDGWHSASKTFRHSAYANHIPKVSKPVSCSIPADVYTQSSSDA